MFPAHGTRMRRRQQLQRKRNRRREAWRRSPCNIVSRAQRTIRITIDMTHAIKILQEHNFKHHGSCFKLQRSQIKRWQADVGTSVERCSAKRQSAGTPYMLTKNPVRSTTRTSRRYLQSFKIRSCQILTKRKAMTTQEATTTNQILTTTTTMPLQFYFNANQHDLLAPRTFSRSCLPSL